MAGVWKRDGTVTVTSGSKRVIGVGTTFADPKNGVAKGHIFTQISGSAIDLYEVDYVVSNTELYLVQAFRGTTASGAAYAIITTFSDSIPEFSRKLTATLASYQEQSDVLQLLYTSDAAEITVTAPDGTTRKLIPWKRVTSEGEGQAARAKVEADRAKTEADKAAQAVIDSAVPFPDVWIPFNDSLRMFAGHGREVKVGDDVVARMVNFERSTTKTYRDKSGVLRTAAINEPAFEKEGLLIEGQSTNLIARSEGSTFQTANSSFQTLTNDVPGVLPMAGQRISFAANNGETNANLIQTSITLTGGNTYTYSLHLKVEAGDATTLENCVGIYAASGVNVGPRAVIGKIVGDIYRVSVQFTVSGTGSQMVFVRFNRIGSPSAVWTAVVGGVQVELLPFASSYIPTNGAAAIRAADKCWIRNLLNMPQNISKSSFSLQFSLLGIMSDDILRRVLWSEDSGGPFFGVRIKGSDCLAISSRDSVGEANKYTIQSGEHTISFSSSGYAYLDGVRSTTNASTYKGSPTADIGIGCASGGITQIYGHVRNLRIWQQPLSDAQTRGLK